MKPISLSRPLLFLVCIVVFGSMLSSCSTTKTTSISQTDSQLSVNDDWALGKFEPNYRAKEFDVSAPLKINALKGFTRKGYAEQQTGIYIMEPFDPQKVPVLFIHGLLSAPGTWRTMVEALRKEPEIMDRYQFWFYAYPSGTPVVPSAAMLKMHLDSAISSVEKDFGVSMDRRLIVVGHSMGGILTKSLVSSTGDRLWDGVFNAPLEEFDLPEEQRQLLGQAFRYEPRRYVNTAIFIATPHRGSDLATSAVGRIGSSLSARPKAIEELSRNLITRNRDLLKPEFAAFVADNVNSISTLRPDSPVTALLADLPIDPDVTYHTLAGLKPKLLSRGKTRDGDSVVPLESTVIPGARCEVGVFAGHFMHQTEEARQTVSLLLRQHSGLIDESEMREALGEMHLAFARYNTD